MSSEGKRERRAWGGGQLVKRKTGWYIRYRDASGKRRSEATRTHSRSKAEEMLRERLGAKKRGELLPDAKKVTFEQLLALREHRRTIDGHRSRHDLTRLCEYFEGWRALAITTEAVTAYEASRLKQGVARATVNADLNALRRMFNLAVEAKLLLPTQCPRIRTPNPKNARTGFFEADDFEAVLAELPDYLRAPMSFAYLTGWRRSEILSRQWRHVDFDHGTIRLDQGETKNGRGRSFPFDVLPALKALLEEQREHTTLIERATGARIPWVFHHDGQRIKNYYTAWNNAVDRAAHGGKKPGELRVLVRPSLAPRTEVDSFGRSRVVRPIPHDFRRTAVRRLVRAGVSEHIAMDLVGHRTRSMLDRYDIINDADVREAVSRIATKLGGSSPMLSLTARRRA